MSQLVSLLVATYNSASTLEALLISIKRQTYSQIEIVVVDNNSKDNTIEIAEKYTHKVFTKGPERSAQRNYAALNSKGDYLIVLDSDMVLTPNVVIDVVNTFNSHKKKVALVIPEQSFGIGFWANCKKLERSFYINVPWMEAARAFRRNEFNLLGGYDEENTGTEDYDLPHRVKSEYGVESIGRVSSMILHNEGRLSLLQSCKKKYYYASTLDVYVNKPQNKDIFSVQSNPFRRFSLYFSSPSKLFKNPILGIGMLYMKICELSSGMAGFLLRKQSSDLKNSIYK